MQTRRVIIGAGLAGVGMSLVPAAFAAPARTVVPGAGSVIIPKPYKSFPPGDYRHRDTGGVIAYRNYRSTMAGTNESDGAIAVGAPEAFENLAAFIRLMRGGLTSRWSSANESEGRWYGKPETFAEATQQGSNGEERVGALSIHVVGWTVYDAPGAMYAVNDRRGVMIAVWIFDKHGGEKRARRHAEDIARSFSA